VALISKEVYVEIQILKKQGFSLRRIAREVGVAVNTIRRQLAQDAVPKYERKVKRATKLAPFETYLRERVAAAKPQWIPATVLYREIQERGYGGGQTRVRSFLRTLKPMQAQEPVVRFETTPGEQLQVDWVEFRKGRQPLYAFCATLGYSRASYVEFVSDMKVQTLIDCHQRAFAEFAGVPRRILYDNMWTWGFAKTVVLERDSYGDGQHRFHAGFLDYAKHCGFVIKLCRPYRAKTKGKVERFNGYLRRSFYVPLLSRLSQAGLQLDVVTANLEVSRWLRETANERIHGTTEIKPSVRLKEEQAHLQRLPAPWRADVAQARPQSESPTVVAQAPVRPAQVRTHLEQVLPEQHPLAVYAQLLAQMTQAAWPQGAQA
jgi:transposase